jgi:transcriptional regulator with XRE-family HTH domain
VQRTILVFHQQKAGMSVFAKRLKEARQRAGLSQEKLGIEADLDPVSASTRMNRYELGKRMPDVQLVERIAAVLKAPTAYFYSVDDDEAELLLKYHRLSKKQRAKVVAFVDELVA